MAKKFDYSGARKAGYSDEEITQHLSEVHPTFNLQAATEAGYSPSEINKHLATYVKPRSLQEHARTKVGGPAIEVLTHAITSLPNTLDIIPKLSSKGAQALLGRMGYKVSDEDADKVYQSLKAFSPTSGIPQAGQLVESIHDVTGGRFRPQTEGEEILHKGSGILGSIAGLGPEAALGTPLKAAGTLAASGVTPALEHQGINPWLSALGGIGADILTKSLGNIGKRLFRAGKDGVAKTLGEVTGKVVSQDQVKQEVINAAERLGIEDLPLSAQVDNPVLRGIESKVRASSLSGKKLDKQLEATGEKLVKSYEDVGSQVSARKDLLPGAVAEEGTNALMKIEEAGEDAYRSLYSQAAKELPEGVTVPQNIGRALHKVVESTMKKLKSSLGTSSKDTLYKRLERLRENWNSTPAMRQGNIPVQELIDAKQDLNQIIKYDIKGGADKLLTPFFAVTKNGILEYGKQYNPKFLSRFQGAESAFKKNAEIFRKNPMMRQLVKGERPEQIFGKMNSVKGIRELGKVFNRSPEGKQAFDAIKKYKLEELIGSKLVNKNGKISWGNASGMFKNAKNRELLLELVGPQGYKNIKDIARVSQGVEEGLRKFLNNSQSASTAMDVALLVSAPVKAIAHLFSGNIVGAAKNTGFLFSPYLLAQLIANPEFVNAIKATARAGKGSSSQAFLEKAKRAGAIVAGTVSALGGPEEVGQDGQQAESIPVP